jgi:phosphate-selective porin OprO/OprP
MKGKTIGGLVAGGVARDATTGQSLREARPFGTRLLARSSLLALGVCAGLMAVAPGAMAAASDADVKRLEDLIKRLETQHEAEIRDLKAQIEQLKGQQAAQAPKIEQLQSQQAVQTPQIEQLKAQQAAQAKQATAQQVTQPASPTGTTLIESPTHQFGLSSANGQNTIAIIARLQIDAGDYLHVGPQGGAKGAGPGSSPTTELDSGVNARRARLGIGGTFMSDWSYRLIYDFGASSDSVTTGVSGAATSGVENAYFTYNGFNRQTNFFPVAFDAGYLDVPWTIDESTSSNDIMFLERSSSQVIATEFGGGDFRSAVGMRSNNKDYFGSLYVTGPLSGAPHTGASNNAGSVLGRFGYNVLNTPDAILHLGVNAGHLFQARAPYNSAATGPATNSEYLVLSDRPELRIDPTNILNSGGIPTTGATVAGVEAAAQYDHFFAQGEYYHYSIDQYAGGINPTDGKADVLAPTLDFHGGYAEASYSIGGKRRYIPETGAWSGVIPDAPFDISGDGFGAFELAARISEVDLNDHLTPGVAPHLTGGVNGGQQETYSIGLNWYPNINMKFMLDYLHANVNKLKADTTGTYPSTPSGASIDAVAVRMQFAY